MTEFFMVLFVWLCQSLVLASLAMGIMALGVFMPMYLLFRLIDSRRKRRNPLVNYD